MRQRFGRMEKDPAVDVTIKLFVAGSQKSQLLRAGFVVKTLFHAEGGRHSLDGVNAFVHQSVVENFGKPKRRPVILNQNDVIFLQDGFFCRCKRPEEDIGVMFQVFFREHVYGFLYNRFAALAEFVEKP